MMTEQEVENNFNLMKKNDYKRVIVLLIICISLVLIFILFVNLFSEKNILLNKAIKAHSKISSPSNNVDFVEGLQTNTPNWFAIRAQTLNQLVDKGYIALRKVDLMPGEIIKARKWFDKFNKDDHPFFLTHINKTQLLIYGPKEQMEETYKDWIRFRDTR